MEKFDGFSFNNAKLKYISCKEQYDQQYAYFVIDHEKTKEEFKKIQETYLGVKLPFFVSDTTGDYILKVNAKKISNFDELVLKEQYKATVSMAGYIMNDSQGLFVRK
jgi:hypothetical protein